jgi:hypothetical protein
MASIDILLRGSSRKSNPRPPCSIISAKAVIVVTEVKESDNNEKKLVNFHAATDKANTNVDRIDITSFSNDKDVKTNRDVITAQVQAINAIRSPFRPRSRLLESAQEPSK